MMNPDGPSMVAQHVAGYLPRHVSARSWARQQAGVREAALLAASTVPMVKVVLPALAGFGAWLLAEGYEVSLDRLVDRELIERYTQVGMPGKSEATRATRRATLRRAAARIRPEQFPSLEAISYRRARTPYTDAEVAHLFAVARCQPTRALHRSLTAILTLGLGCGLHRQDLAWVRGVDVRSHAGAVVVTVAGGPRPRTVVALDRYADTIARCARHAGEGLVIGGMLLGRSNVTSPTLDRIVQDRSAPRVVPARLRSTWLVTHLNLHTPLSALLPAAGMASSRTLDDLLDYTDPITEDRSVQLLRGIRPPDATP